MKLPRSAQETLFVALLGLCGALPMGCRRGDNAAGSATADRSPQAPSARSATEGSTAFDSTEGKHEAGGRPAEAKPSDTAISRGGWSTLEECRAVLVKLGPRPEVAPYRFGTWNVRWFPDGKPGKKPAKKATDLTFLACAVASLQVDALAVQEWKTLPRSLDATHEFLAELSRLTGGSWKAQFDDCPHGATQHVGIVYDEKRIRFEKPTTHAVLNPHGQPCKDQLRPGFGADLHLKSGQVVHLVSVHLKSGTERRSVNLRRRSFEAMGDVARLVRERRPGTAILFAGDFNTMGCPSCSPQLSADEERNQSGKVLSEDSLVRLSQAPKCTQYYRGEPGALDGFITRAPFEAEAQVEGYCAAVECASGIHQGKIAAYRDLSDHCPVVLEWL